MVHYSTYLVASDISDKNLLLITIWIPTVHILGTSRRWMQYHNDFIKLSLYSFLLKVVLHTQQTISSNSSPLTQVPMHMYSIHLLTGSKAGPWDSIWPGMHQCHHNHIAFCHWASPLLWMLLRHCFSEISSQQMGQRLLSMRHIWVTHKSEKVLCVALSNNLPLPIHFCMATCGFHKANFDRTPLKPTTTAA